MRRPVVVLAVTVFLAATLGVGIYRVRSQQAKLNIRESAIRLPQGQRFFIVARDDWTDGWTAEDEGGASEHIEVDERAERLAREEFAAMGGVKIVKREQDADFVFLMVIEPASGKHGVLAEIFPAGCSHDSETPGCASKWSTLGDSPADVVRQFCGKALSGN